VVLLAEMSTRRTSHHGAQDAAGGGRSAFHRSADLHVTTSIGVSVFPEDGRDAETLIRNADTAMYQAKENGRQSYQFFRPDMNARAVERQFIEEGYGVPWNGRNSRCTTSPRSISGPAE